MSRLLEKGWDFTNYSISEIHHQGKGDPPGRQLRQRQGTLTLRPQEDKGRTKSAEILWIFFGIHIANALEVGRRMWREGMQQAALVHKDARPPGISAFYCTILS